MDTMMDTLASGRKTGDSTWRQDAVQRVKHLQWSAQS
jgi:hypothetical protein